MAFGSTNKNGPSGGGDAYWLLVDSSGRILVSGAAAEDAAASGNPILVAGRYDTSARTLDDGDTGTLAVDAAGRIHVVGAAAEDAAATGNPLLIGGRYDSTVRDLNTGDVGAPALDVTGRLQTVPNTDVLTATLVLDTNPYASGDVLVVAQEITGAALISGGRIKIESVVLLDQDDQAGALDLVFLNANGSLGTINDAVNISDADANKIVGVIEIVAADYVDLANSQIVVKSDIGVMAELSATSLWVGAISRDTKTYSASGITLKIGVTQY